MKRSGTADDRKVEALLSGHGGAEDHDLVDLLAEVRRFGGGPVPVPSSVLAAILDGSTPRSPSPTQAAPKVRPRPARSRIRAGVVLLVATTSLGAAGAAANAFPAPAQHAAASLLNVLTPFHFPQPATAQRSRPTPEPAVPATPGAPVAPGPYGGSNADQNGTDQTPGAIPQDPPDSPMAGDKNDGQRFTGQRQQFPQPEDNGDTTPAGPGPQSSQSPAAGTHGATGTAGGNSNQKQQPSITPDPEANPSPDRGHADS